MSTHRAGAARGVRGGGGGNGGGGKVIAFPGRPVHDNRLAMRDRITLLAWADRARARGVSRVVIEHWEPGDDPAVVGEFALIYPEGRDFARWSVARSAGRYQLWETAFGRTLGVFASLGDALAGVEAWLPEVKPSSTPARHAAPGRADRAGADRDAAEPAGRERAVR